MSGVLVLPETVNESDTAPLIHFGSNVGSLTGW